MEHHFSRQELFDLVWSRPMSHLAAEFSVTPDMLLALLRKAHIPRPPAGHWMRKEFGKAIAQPPLPPPPPGCTEPLVLDARRRASLRAGGKPARAEPATERVEARPSATSPSSSRVTTSSDEEALAGGRSAPTAGPSAPATGNPVAAAGPTVEPAPASPRSAPTPRPTTPTTLTREELHAAVWAKPMARLAEDFGISGNGLAKICERAKIPYPPRGFWARRAAGQTPRQAPLPASEDARPIIIRPTPPPSVPAPLPPEAGQLLDKVLAREATLKVNDRLVRPHPIIASWLAAHEEERRKARSERDPWRREIFAPKDFTEVDRRRHRILDALFKAIERHGGKITEGDRKTLFIETLGERTEIQLREKNRQRRVPLTDEERRWRTAGADGWRQELVPTGMLVLEVKTWTWPQGLARQWLETDRQPLEEMLPGIVATFVAAGPLLVDMRRQKEAAERERQLAEQRRHEEERRRKRDRNQWRRFQEMAQAWQDLATVRRFLAALREMQPTSGDDIGGRSVEEWIAWAEDWMRRTDPLADGPQSMFGQIAAVTDWTYRD